MYAILDDEFKEQYNKLGIDDDELTQQFMVVVTQLKKAMNGDVRAAEFLRDLVGEKPLNRDEVANTLPVKTKVSMIVHVLDDADDSDDADTDVTSRIANKLLLDRR